MRGCSEQKYSWVPSAVKVKEKLSSVSSACDLKSRLDAVTVCGMSSSLRQVTVVPAFTVRRAGAKVKLSMVAVASSAPTTAWEATAPVRTPASKAAAADSRSWLGRASRMTKPSGSALQGLVDEREALLPAYEIH